MIINRDGEKIYRNPITGKEYLLMLCMDLECNGTYDIIAIFEHSEDEPIGEYVDHFFGATICMEDDAKLDKEIESRLASKGLTAMIGMPQVFYTGGGFWISAMYIDATHYAVIGNDDEELISIYDHSENEDDDTLFPCQNFIENIPIESVDELDSEKKKIYNTLLTALRSEMHS